jgi:hypothetical protein
MEPELASAESQRVRVVARVRRCQRRLAIHCATPRPPPPRSAARRVVRGPRRRRRTRTCSTGRRRRRAITVAGSPTSVACRSIASSRADHGRADRRGGRPSAARRAATASWERPSSRAIAVSGVRAPVQVSQAIVLVWVPARRHVISRFASLRVTALAASHWTTRPARSRVSLAPRPARDARGARALDRSARTAGRFGHRVSLRLSAGRGAGRRRARSRCCARRRAPRRPV